jgi:Ca2+/Na+ antiporter
MKEKTLFLWKELSKKWFIYCTIIYLLVMFLVIYFELPYLNLTDVSFYYTLMLAISYPIAIVLMLIYKRKDSTNGTKTTKSYVYNNGKWILKEKDLTLADSVFKTLFKILAVSILCLGICKLSGIKLFNAKAYANQLEITTGTKEDLNKTFDYEEGEVKLPVIDKELAAKLAQAKLEEYGSQYSIDIYNFTIISVERNGGTELLRVTPLEYDNIFVAMSRMNKGTVGYIEVNVVTQVAKLVKFDDNDGLKYMPSGILKYDLDRHIRKHYPSALYNHKYFEIDNEGNPYWVVPTIKKSIGVFDGETPNGVLLVNPITGEIQKYNLGEQPSWVQRCVDEHIMEVQANNALSLKNGFWNTLFAKKEVFQLSDGYNYLLKDNATYYISCITSPNENDQTSIGFLIINLKTKEAIRYSCPGITEMRAREIAMYDERVKAQELEATWPILVSYHGVPTYFVVLKNDVQFQKAVFLNVDNGALVGMGSDITNAKVEYDNLLSNESIVQKENKEVTGKVTKIRDLGNSIEFMIDTMPDVYFSCDINISLVARFLSVGENVIITYNEYPTYNLVVDIKLE